MPQLGRLMVEESKKREKKFSCEASMWDFDAKKYLKVWRACVEALDVQELAISPYQNRHGGASRDHLMKLRSVPAIQRRGRWASDSSARIYDKPGRLQQVLNRFSQDLQPFGELVRTNFTAYYQGGRVPLPRPVRCRVHNCFKA